MRLSQAEYRQVEEIFHGPDGSEMMEFLSGLSVGRNASDFSDKLKAVAASMGWLKSSGDMTELGHAVAASCREILFWQERDRKLPFADAAPWLDASYFKGRTVAEIGSGAGAVLMSIEGAKKLIGIEPMEIYRQLGAILRARIGLADPEMMAANGEALPFEDASIDVVLSVASHQYFDIASVMGEISRVLKPGGEVFIVGKTFAQHFRTLPPRTLLSRAIKREGICLANTAWYSLTKRRAFPITGVNTSRPIYPTVARMRRWMSDAGIEPDRFTLPVHRHSLQRGVKLGDVAVEASEVAREAELMRA